MKQLLGMTCDMAIVVTASRPGNATICGQHYGQNALLALHFGICQDIKRPHTLYPLGKSLQEVKQAA